MENELRTYKVSVERVASWVSVGKDERLSSLARSPEGCEFGGVPVHLVEDMRSVDPSRWAVSVSWKLHVRLVRVQTLARIIAGWKVDVSSERRRISIAVLVRKANASA